MLFTSLLNQRRAVPTICTHCRASTVQRQVYSKSHHAYPREDQGQVGVVALHLQEAVLTQNQQLAVLDRGQGACQGYATHSK
jgi:hypothetical protein